MHNCECLGVSSYKESKSGSIVVKSSARGGVFGYYVSVVLRFAHSFMISMLMLNLEHGCLASFKQLVCETEVPLPAEIKIFCQCRQPLFPIYQCHSVLRVHPSPKKVNCVWVQTFLPEMEDKALSRRIQ